MRARKVVVLHMYEVTDGDVVLDLLVDEDFHPLRFHCALVARGGRPASHRVGVIPKHLRARERDAHRPHRSVAVPVPQVKSKAPLEESYK